MCSYLSFYDPRLDTTFRLPLVHIRIKHGDIQFRTDALVDSGATGTFIPIELTEILGIEIPEERQDVVGAGSVFSSFKTCLDLIEIYKSSKPFCCMKNVNVLIPIAEGALPHSILGRDSLFWVHDITFRERRQNTIFREPKK